MGLLNLWRRGKDTAGDAISETRDTGTGYTEAVMAARDNWITGASCMGEATATVQASVALWESGLALADVTGTDMLTPHTLALTARALALQGEVVFLIRDRLISITDFDTSTHYAAPDAYRVDVPDAAGVFSGSVRACGVISPRRSV